jgi:hypothetical protein
MILSLAFPRHRLGNPIFDTCHARRRIIAPGSIRFLSNWHSWLKNPARCHPSGEDIMNRSNETRLRKLESETAGDAGLALIAFGPGETAEEATARFFTRRPQEGRSFARSVSTRAFYKLTRHLVASEAAFRRETLTEVELVWGGLAVSLPGDVRPCCAACRCATRARRC